MNIIIVKEIVKALKLSHIIKMLKNVQSLSVRFDGWLFINFVMISSQFDDGVVAQTTKIVKRLAFALG